MSAGKISELSATLIVEALLGKSDGLASLWKKDSKSIEEKKVQLIKELTDSGIDPDAFDVLISKEIDRRLKVQFGITFLIFTFIFTAMSSGIVITDGLLGLGISEIAVTALVIETPIQFIGLLYIIARNLFPNH